MARRVTHASSRGSKKRPSVALPADSSALAKGAPVLDVPAAPYSDTTENLFSTEVSFGADYGPRTAEGARNEILNGSASTPVEERPIAPVPSSESEQRRSGPELLSPPGPPDDDFSADHFDEAGYLRLNPDVRRAVESGQIESGYSHYLWHGRTEGRALPDTPREARNVMLAAPDDAARLDVFPKEARCSIEALIIAPAAGLMIVGWIDDALHPLSCIRITGPDWRVVIDASRFFRVRRMDVENALGGRRLHPFGFVGFLQFDSGGHGSGPLRIELWQAGGFSTSVQCAPAFVEDVELRDTILAQLASASFFGSAGIESLSYLERGVGAELVRFNLAISRRIVSTPYVERFGPEGKSPRGTIVVCLYGKPEFFFVQNCLYAGLPGIEDYEFVYVSNSPEMAESLLREAHCANLLYGLPVSIVILPGNAGFGAANNAAARIARSDRLLVVNPDVFPYDRDWAAKHTALVTSAPAQQSRLFGVPLYYADGSLMHGGIYFEVDVGLSLSGGKVTPARICRTEHYGKGAPAGTLQFNRPRPVPAVTGAFISIERSWFEQLGGFTEDFIFGHYEDADLCLKSIARGTAPWIHDIRLWHLEGKGSTRLAHHEGGSIVNRWLFSRTWMSAIEQGLTGPAPTHPLVQPASRPAWVSDNENRKRKFVRQKRVAL